MVKLLQNPYRYRNWFRTNTSIRIGYDTTLALELILPLFRLWRWSWTHVGPGIDHDPLQVLADSDHTPFLKLLSNQYQSWNLRSTQARSFTASISVLELIPNPYWFGSRYRKHIGRGTNPEPVLRTRSATELGLIPVLELPLNRCWLKLLPF